MGVSLHLALCLRQGLLYTAACSSVAAFLSSSITLSPRSLCCRGVVIADRQVLLYVDLNPGAHTFMASPLPTEPSPLTFPLFTFFFKWYWGLNPGLCASKQAFHYELYLMPISTFLKEFSVVLIIFLLFDQLVKLFILQN